jgi:hypothetical protein
MYPEGSVQVEEEEEMTIREMERWRDVQRCHMPTMELENWQLAKGCRRPLEAGKLRGTGSPPEPLELPAWQHLDFTPVSKSDF